MLESRLPVVAVVDDQEAKRYAMARTLRGAGFSVREGGSGREALSLASEAPDVLVLDIKLPDANGLELCRQIKANPQTASVLVLVVSAYQTSEADRAEGLESGADAYLTHPVEPPVLVATARALLRLRRAEQERSEALVRERSARSEAESAAADFRTLAESVPHLVWKARPDGQVDYVNSRWTEYTGMAAEASFGFSFVDAVHPDDRAAYLASWRRNVSVGAHEDAEVRLRRASDGRYRWYLVRSRPLRDEGGQTTGWVGTCTDVDDQKRAVEASQMLAEVSKALGAAITVDAMAEAVVQLCVPALGTFCALDMVTEEGAVRRVSLQVGKAPRAELVEPLGALKRSGPDAGPGHILRHGDVEWVPQVDDAWLSRAFPETDARKVWHALALRSFFSVPLHSRGGVLGALSLGNTDGDNGYEAWKQPLVEDLARRVGPALENARLFDLARRERDNAEEANRAKDEFLAVVSHELRTPLNAMLGWTQMLRSGLLSLPKQERALEAVERNVRVQTQLIDDLLDISRIITGKLRLNVGPTSPALVMEAALDSVRPAAEAKGIHLVAHMEGNGTPVTGDPDRLQQVVWNLLSNGIKFTPPGGTVELSASRTDSILEIRVRDTGVGISSEFLPYVFERFRQADPTPTRTAGGMGLGLAIVRHLVELHGGTIEGRSEGAGKGALFIVRLPVGPPAMTAGSGRPEPALRSFGSQPIELEGRRILMVDDQAESRELVATVLQSFHAEVSSSPSGADALERLHRERFDLIVSDVGMPDMDGYALIRRIRRELPVPASNIPAVALTAYARSEERSTALKAGFDVHVPKPVEPAKLLRVLMSVLKEHGGPLESGPPERH